MTQKTIELASIDQAQELVIDERTIATYDAAQGPLTVARLVNYGTLRILGENLQEAQIVAQSIYNLGAIESALPDLTLQAAEIKAGKSTGSFSAAGSLHLKNDGDLRVSDGTFRSSILNIVSGGKAAIHADCIEGEVHIKACELSIGVRRGDLTVTQQELLGDPVYYNGGGNLTISPTLTRGDDFSCFATGNITINGAIDLMGGDVANHPLGRVVLVPGCVKVEYNQVPNNEGQFECTDCSLPQPLFEVIPSIPPAGTVTVNGDISVKGLSISAGDVVLNGAVTVDNANIPWDANIAGNCSMFGSNSVTVTGLVKVISRRPSGVFKGGFTVGAGQNITLANVDAGLLAQTSQSGLIKVGNVDADFGSIVMLAGGDFGSGGGGIIGGAALQSVTLLSANIQSGTLKSQSQVRLMANGTIGTGTITLDPEPFSGPNSFVVPHDVRIHANINKETTTPFLAGGGSTNGTGQITITNRSYVAFDGGKAGVIAISNGPTGDIHVNGSRLKCIAGDKGIPSIVIDAGSGQVRLTGGSPLSVDGDASHDAGFIVLQGGELRAPNAAVVSASDTQGSAETETPTVILAVDKITLPGSLTVNCNGNTGTSVKLAPKGSAGLDIVNIDYTQPIRPQSVSPVVHELAITGAGSLTLTANSKNGSILCSGDPLRFANQGATHIESEGDDSKIELKFAGSPSGQESLIFTGGAVEVIVDNPQHDGGTILVTADKVKNTASSVSMHANALSDGKGGTISLDIDRGNLALGTDAGTMSLAATGMGSGKGGSISVENAQHNGTITLDTTFSAAAVNVAALGSNGDGGTIDLHADHLVNNATGGNSGLVANGAGTGKGGNISLRLTDDITIGGAPGLVITAISTGSGDGGDVDIVTTKSSLVIDAGSINVNGGTDGKGGKITAKTLQSGSTLTVNGSLTANGQNTKKGGNIKVIAAGLLNIASAQFHADGGPRGAGGSVELSAAGDLTVTAGQVTALAGTLGSNKGGDISLSTTAGGNLTVNSDLKVDGAGNGKGGSLTLSSDGAMDLSQAFLSANGGSNGDGGSINLGYKSATELMVRDLLATGGTTNGGSISVSNQSNAELQMAVSGTIDTSIEDGATLGGSIDLIVQDAQSQAISMVIEESGAFMSVLSAVGASVLVCSTPPIYLGVRKVEATNGPISLTASDGTCGVAMRERSLRRQQKRSALNVTDSVIEAILDGQLIAASEANGNILLRASKVVFNLGPNIQTPANLNIRCKFLQNSRTLQVGTCVVQIEPTGDSTSNYILNTGIIEATDESLFPEYSVWIRGNYAVLNFDGGGTLKARNISIDTTSENADIVFRGSQRLVQTSSASEADRIDFYLPSGGRLVVPTAQSLLVEAENSDEQGPRLSLISPTIATIANDGLIAAGSIRVVMRDIAITGATGILQCNSLSLQTTAGGASVEQSKILTADGLSALLGGNVALDLNVLVHDSGLRLGDITASDGHLQIQALGLTVQLASTVKTGSGGEVVLLSPSGSIQCLTDSAVAAVGGNVTIGRFLPANQVPGNAPSSAVVDASVIGSGAIYWGANGVSAIAPGSPANKNTVLAFNRSVIFDGAPGQISLNGGVNIQAI